MADVGLLALLCSRDKVVSVGLAPKVHDIPVLEPHCGVGRFLWTRGTWDCFLQWKGPGKVRQEVPVGHSLKIPASIPAAMS